MLDLGNEVRRRGRGRLAVSVALRGAGAGGRPAPAAEPIFTLTRLTPGSCETAFEALLWSAALAAGDCPAKASVKETSASWM